MLGKWPLIEDKQQIFLDLVELKVTKLNATLGESMSMPNILVYYSSLLVGLNHH